MALTKDILKLEMRIPLDLLWRDEKNYLDKLTEDIKEHGITEPIEIRVREDGSQIVWDGLHRLAIAERLEMEEIPVIYTRMGGAAMKNPALRTNPRPPKKWFADMVKSLELQYPKKRSESPSHYNRAIAQIAGGIWWNVYTPKTRRHLILRYDNPLGGLVMKSNVRTREGVVSGQEAEQLHKDRMRELQRMAKESGKRVAAGIYGSLWCPICKDYTGQQRYITPAGRERWRCMGGDHTFSRGKHGWLEKYNPTPAELMKMYSQPIRRRNPRRATGGMGLLTLALIAGGIWWVWKMRQSA